MKKILFLFSFASLLLFTRCGNKTTSDAQELEVPKGMMTIDLSSHGFPILINIPDSSTGEHQIEENAFGGINIKAGQNFQLSIIEGSGNFDIKRSDISTDGIRKLVRYIKDEPSTLFWEWKIEGLESEFHFYAVINAGGKSYEVQDIEGEMFSENTIAKMLESAKSIRTKDTAEAN